MFSRLVLRNARRSRNENLIYFATLITAVASFYIILSLGKQDVIFFLREFESHAIDNLLTEMRVVYAFALFLLFFLILFANRYQLNRRSKEFGLYLMLGMRKERLVVQLLAEGLVTSVLALAGGLLIGGFLAEIISLAVSKWVGQGIIGHRFSLSASAMFFTVIGFLFIQFLALAMLGGKLFQQEVYQLLNEQMDKKTDVGHVKGNVLHIAAGCLLLGGAYWIALRHLADFAGLLVFAAVALGSMGTLLMMRGAAKLLGLLAGLSERNATKGLRTFTLRQFQENIANRSASVAVTSILIALSMMLIANGASTLLSAGSHLYNRDASLYDFTVNGAHPEAEKFLTSAAMAPYVEDLNLLEVGRMKAASQEEGALVSFVDWSKLREQLIMALPDKDREQWLSGEMQGYTISLENPEALNLLGILELDARTPYLIPESSYNGLLEAIGRPPLSLHADEMALYFNPDFVPMDNLDRMPVLDRILEQAANEGQRLISIHGQAIDLRPSVPRRGLVADRSVEIYSAFIVPDSMFEQFVNKETYMSYWNFRIPQKLQEQQGLMQPMMEARDILQSAGFRFESYLQNFGRKLFYVVAGSYTVLYLGFLFLIMACTVLALQFLTQMKQTRKRYLTLTMLGAKREQMKKSMRRQVLWTFLLPLSLACVSGAVGIKTMASYVMNHIENKALLYPVACAFACMVVGIMAIYGAAVARTADREIEQLRWKPDPDIE